QPIRRGTDLAQGSSKVNVMAATVRWMHQGLVCALVIAAQALLGGCDGLCDDVCFRTRVTCEESCDRHFEREFDPYGWATCVSQCGADHDGCQSRCDQQACEVD